jgi:signal transduction histidine kinase
VPEIAELALTLHDMAEQLAVRFQALRAEQQETHTLIESMTDGVIAADTRGEIGTCNTAARRLLGYSGTDPLPPLGELFHDKRARDLLRNALAGRDVEQQELHREDRVLLVTARVLPTDGVLLMLRDVTAIRRLEAMRRDFVANVSHELKTPISALRAHLENLLDGVERPDPETLQVMLAQSERLGRLVDQLLDLSRLESGDVPLHREEVALAPLVSQVLSEIEVAGAGRTVELERAVPDDLPAVYADRERIHQVLFNLLDNAVRFTPAGGRVTVSADRHDGSVDVHVADTGPGIPPEHLPRLFERFYRADPARSQKEGGTGIGLAIARSVVEAHGGRIWADSSPGQGSVFTFELPVAPATETRREP